MIRASRVEGDRAAPGRGSYGDGDMGATIDLAQAMQLELAYKVTTDGKATVQVKVKIVKPDSYLRPDMNATVAFYSGDKPAAAPKPTLAVPPAAVRDGAVFVVLDGKAVRRPLKDLIGGEDVVLSPPASLQDGDRVRVKKG